MKRLLAISFLFLGLSLTRWAQDGPKCEQINSEGLLMTIALSSEAFVQNQITISLKNLTDKDLSFCWFDLQNTWGLPLCMSLSVEDAAGKIIKDKFNWANYFSPTSYANYKKKAERIEIRAGDTYTKDIVLYWPDMLPGRYIIHLTAVEHKPLIESNEIVVNIK
jgi:hypothetical protein